MWEEVLLFLVPFGSQFFMHLLRLFGLSHFGIFSCNFYIVLCSEVLNQHLLHAVYMYISYAVLIFKIWAYREFQRIFKTFIWKKGWCTYAYIYIYMKTHFSIFSRTAWWIFTKLGRNEVLMVLHECCCFLGHRSQSPIVIMRSPAPSVH